MRQRVKNGRITNRKRDFIGKHIRNGSHANEIPNGCDVKEDTSLYMRRQMLYATVLKSNSACINPLPLRVYIECNLNI